MCCWSKRGQENEALGRSSGGFSRVPFRNSIPGLRRATAFRSSKLHTIVDGLGNPLKFVLTAGQIHDVTQAEKLLLGLSCENLLGDKAYDAEHLLKLIAQLEAQAIIPPRQNRKQHREYDKALYKERHLIECFFYKLKYYRRVFSRFDKRGKNYLAFVYFAASLIWLR